MATTARKNASRATPPIQTNINDANRNQRYSYMETPVEMQRSTFEQYHQFSSPTNSIIDESPITPASPGRGLPAYPQGPQATTGPPLPLEKGQVQSPHEVHPAFYAPYEVNTRVQQAQTSLVSNGLQSPGPIPVKMQGHPAQPPVASINQTFDPPPKNTPEPNTGVERRVTYNPDSLSGPNGAPADNHRPGQVSHPNANVDPHWKQGLCEPDTLCCMGIICPCMVYGKTTYRLSRRAQRQDPTDLLGYESCNGACGLMAVACGFQWVLAAIHRTRIRKLYHLEGSFGTDCVKSLCCCCCVVTQNEREVRDREELIRRHAGPASGAYVTPGTMTYAPPPR